VDPVFELALVIKALDRELQRRINDAMTPLGVTAAQADALVVIGQAGRVSLKDLGDLLIAEGGHPSRLVDRLVEAGLVERRTAADDRRRIELSLTSEGKRVVGRINQTRDALKELGRQLIPERDLNAAMKALRRMLEHTPHTELVARRRELEEQGES
jgi:MarR family transcriptional regulator, organic hydroperoxide resistance regulator